jgi:hypothetical protein
MFRPSVKIAELLNRERFPRSCVSVSPVILLDSTPAAETRLSANDVERSSENRSPTGRMNTNGIESCVTVFSPEPLPIL